ARVRDILDNNKAERHLRGGEATRQKYLQEKDRNLKGLQ
ncbi:MAG: sporulation transcriptional regulator SpoIIID, partial [Clostridiales bacterium]